MMRANLFSVVLGLAAASPAVAQNPGPAMPPPMRSIDRATLPAAPPRYEVPLYTTDLKAHYQEIANVDSYLSTDKCEDTTRHQLRDLQAKGQALGADALIRVRPLANKAHGWKENPDTPFWSVKQGESDDYFFRATAIKYVKAPVGTPEPLPVKSAGRPAPQQSSPLIDTNRILKLNTDRTRLHEMSVPEVYTTQQPQGR